MKKQILTIAIVSSLGTAGFLPGQTAAPSPESFETPPTLSAAAILQPAYVQGAHFQVQDAVPTEDGINTYSISSDFGPFQAKGNAMLMRRVAEIKAIAALNDLSATKQFEAAAAKAAKSPLLAAKNLVANPIDTLSGVQKGVWKFLNQAGQSVKEIGEGRPLDPVDGGMMSNAIGYSKVKRDIALRLGVDPYSNNLVFQKALDKVAWPAFAGGFVVKLGIAGASFGLGAAGTAISATDMTGYLNDMLRDNNATELQLKNLGLLLAMGLNRADANAFLNNTAISPTTQTILVAALGSLSEATGRDHFIRLAAAGTDEQKGLFFQQSGQLMAKLNGVMPVTLITDLNGLPICQTKTGAVVAPLPWDYLVWTPSTAGFVHALQATSLPFPASEFALVLTGVVSPLADQTLTAGKVRFVEKELPNPLK